LQEAFQNWRNWHEPASKSDGHCAARFSKEHFSLETYWLDFITWQDYPIAGFQNALDATPRNLLPGRRKGFDLSSFAKLSANSKAFGT
jgi:uncharacterized protein (DUF924 family)